MVFVRGDGQAPVHSHLLLSCLLPIVLSLNLRFLSQSIQRVQSRDFTLQYLEVTHLVALSFSEVAKFIPRV